LLGKFQCDLEAGFLQHSARSFVGLNSTIVAARIVVFHLVIWAACHPGGHSAECSVGIQGLLSNQIPSVAEQICLRYKVI
jgi:hypothetical protein